MTKPIIVVVNGTAGEGYWTVHYLLQTGAFTVRATARRPDSDKADELRRMGCEVIGAATEDADALSAAFEGAEGIYGTTIYNIHAKKYVHENPQEMAQGLALIDAAKSCGSLKHFIWQTMTKFDRHPEDIGLDSPIHFRTKWQLEEMVIEASLPWTLLRQPAYMRQIKFGLRGTKRVSYPYPFGTRLAYVAEEDIGKIVPQLFLDRQAFLHKTVNAVSEVLTPEELAQRIHDEVPSFSAQYRQASWLYNAFFDYVVVGMKPAFRYASQINGNLMAGNFFAMTSEDREFCARLISPLKLTTVEDWLQSEFKTA
ncbi:MAG: NmrA family NAD(P)-binding protein [Gammaproteobacteria bacterium]|nr:NmrA family NAD(P)-binding protein [Gammaproteobacteria bacterium]